MGDESTPAPGDYDPTKNMRIGANSNKHDAKTNKNGDPLPVVSFSATEKRLKDDELFGSKVETPTPAPGQYHNQVGTLAKKILGGRRAATAGSSGVGHAGARVMGAGAGFGGSTVRFQKEAPTVDTHGSGYDMNSFVKKSFNRRTGYKPAKSMNRRVVRAHTDHDVTTFGVSGHSR